MRKTWEQADDEGNLEGWIEGRVAELVANYPDANPATIEAEVRSAIARRKADRDGGRA